MFNKKVIEVIVKIGIAILTTLGGYLGASASVHGWI